MNFKGKVSGNKLQLVQGGAPAAVPVQIDFEAGFGIKARSGTLKQGDVHIGKAVAHLTGTYSTAQQTPSVQMKLDGQGMPAADLEGMLPAVGVILPAGTSIQSGTVNASLTIDGPADRLVTSGPVSLSNAKLAGFDLGSKMGALSSFAGVPKGTDTMIQTLSADLRIAPEGMRMDKLLVVVPAIGSISGSGTIAANHALNFKMAAKVGNASSAAGGLARPGLGGGRPVGRDSIHDSWHNIESLIRTRRECGGWRTGEGRAGGRERHTGGTESGPGARRIIGEKEEAVGRSRHDARHCRC